jgi:hypothetical protein
MKAVCLSEMSVNFSQTTQCNIPEDNTIHSKCHENLNSWRMFHRTKRSSDVFHHIPLSESLHTQEHVYPLQLTLMSQNTSESTVLARGWITRQGQGVFLYTLSILILGPIRPLIQWVLGFFSLQVEQPNSKVHHAQSSSAKVKNGGNYTCTTMSSSHLPATGNRCVYARL